MDNQLAVMALEKDPVSSKLIPQAAFNDQYVSTAKAAEMLGLSTTIVQRMVDQNELKGWKTQGGHRRISLASVQDFLSNCRSDTALFFTSKAKLRVFVVVESPKLVAQLKTVLEHWNFPVEVCFFDSVPEAFLEVSSQRPHRLIVEMSMPQMDQERILLALQNFNSKGHKPMPVVLMTSAKSLLKIATADTSASIHLVPGPMSAAWLCGYLISAIAM